MSVATVMPRASEGVDLTKMTRLGDGLQGFVQRVDMQYRRITGA
jgi:hypothetical protein